MGIVPDINGYGLRSAACLVAVLSLLCCSAIGRADDGQVWSGARLGQARALVTDVIAPRFQRAGRIPAAVSVAVGVGGRVVFAEGQGESRPGVSAGPDTVYRIGSISKQFLAAAVLNAIEAERIRVPAGAAVTLDSLVSSVLTDAVSWDDERLPPLTLRSLLTMRADVANFTRKPPVELDPWGSVSVPDLRSALFRMRRKGEDGAFLYSNTAYFVLSEVLRAARSDASYADAVREFAIGRAGLMDTGFAGEGASESIAKPSYGRRPAFIQPVWLQGSADMTSTVLDLHRWNTALMEGKILSGASLAEMFGDAARVDVWTYYGMGWFITHKDGIDSYFHSGSVPGFTGFNAIYRYPDRPWISVSLLTNSDGVEDLPQLADALADLAVSER